MCRTVGVASKRVFVSNFQEDSERRRGEIGSCHVMSGTVVQERKSAIDCCGRLLSETCESSKRRSPRRPHRRYARLSCQAAVHGNGAWSMRQRQEGQVRSAVSRDGIRQPSALFQPHFTARIFQVNHTPWPRLVHVNPRCGTTTAPKDCCIQGLWREWNHRPQRGKKCKWPRPYMRQRGQPCKKTPHGRTGDLVMDVSLLDRE